MSILKVEFMLIILGGAHFLGPIPRGGISTPHSWGSIFYGASFRRVESLLSRMREHTCWGPIPGVESTFPILGEHIFYDPFLEVESLLPILGRAYFMGATLCILLTTLYFLLRLVIEELLPCNTKIRKGYFGRTYSARFP